MTGAEDAEPSEGQRATRRRREYPGDARIRGGSCHRRTRELDVRGDLPRRARRAELGIDRRRVPGVACSWYTRFALAATTRSPTRPIAWTLSGHGDRTQFAQRIR